MSYTPRGLSLEDRLRFKGWDVTSSGCWEFRSSRNTSGYAVLGLHRSSVPAHRIAYSVWVGPIATGHVIRHKCDNPPCINPEHLEVGHQSDNVRDMLVRGRHHRAMSQEQRNTALKLHMEQDMNYAQIGRELELDSSTIRKSIKDDMKKLYELIENREKNG